MTYILLMKYASRGKWNGNFSSVFPAVLVSYCLISTVICEGKGVYKVSFTQNCAIYHTRASLQYSFLDTNNVNIAYYSLPPPLVSKETSRIMEEDGGNTISNEATEPFTMTSIQPELLKDAVDEAKNKVFDFVAEEIAGVFSIEDAAPAWATAISKETFDEIQAEVIKCFEGLGDQLKHLEEVADSLSGFTTDKAFETLLDPEDRPSCSLPNVSPASLSGLPDIPESALDPAKELSSYLYSCLAKTIGDVDLGSIMNPTNNRRDRRDLEENVCPVPPAVPPQTFGVTFALSLGIDANVDVGIQTPSTQIDLKVGSSLGSVTIEAGYDSTATTTKKDRVGFSFNAPFTRFTVSGEKKSSCKAGYICSGTTPSLCPAGKWCKDGSAQDYCEPGYFCPSGSTTPKGKPVKKYTNTLAIPSVVTCAAGREW